MNEPCDRPPAGWTCTRPAGHSGPCAAYPAVPKTRWQRIRNAIARLLVHLVVLVAAHPQEAKAVFTALVSMLVLAVTLGAQTAAPRLGPADIYPRLTLTPGATNPAVTPATIKSTICNPHWSTRSIRPPSSYTTRLKRLQLALYGYADRNLRDYEEDHEISLELGGAPRDPRNLWPEPYKASIPDGGARAKDLVENYLHRQVCDGAMDLRTAQRLIVDDWYRIYRDKRLGDHGTPR